MIRLVILIFIVFAASCEPTDSGANGGIEIETVPAGIDRISDEELGYNVRQVLRDHKTVHYKIDDGTITLYGYIRKDHLPGLLSRIEQIPKKELINKMKVIPVPAGIPADTPVLHPGTY